MKEKVPVKFIRINIIYKVTYKRKRREKKEKDIKIKG